MLNDNMIESIQADIQALDPQADIRQYNKRIKEAKRKAIYNQTYYSKHKTKLRQIARDRYRPVMQAPSDELIDYDEL